MKTQAPYFIIGIIIIVISTPLAYKSVDILYRNQNLTGEYVPILNGFIHSFMLIGLLIFSIGIASLIKCKK